MDLQDARQKADQILDEERQQPSPGYEFVAPPNESTFAALAMIMAPQGLANQRRQRPRQIHENPTFYKFKSTNLELLAILLSQVNEKERQSFFLHIWLRLADPKCCRRGTYTGLLNWGGIVSELSLVAELSIRYGDKNWFFRYLRETRILTPGLLLLLIQFEEILSFNFNLVSDHELELLASTLMSIRLLADQKRRDVREVLLINAETKDYVEISKIASEIINICDGLTEQCRKSRYFYLKGALLQETNLEVNQDKAAVESYLRNLGFNKTLVESLNHAEDLYRSPSPFELKSCMGHLRSFLENLHAEAAGRVAKKAQSPVPSTWGANILFLRQNGIMSVAEEQFLISLYRLISDQAVHSLSAEREYARIARNVVIEYGLVLLSRMDKAGLKP
jgi:hypothetical protein